MQPVVVLFVWAAVVVIGSRVGTRKGRPTLGFLLSLFFGLIGLLVVVLVPARKKELPPPAYPYPPPGYYIPCPPPVPPAPGADQESTRA